MLKFFPVLIRSFTKPPRWGYFFWGLTLLSPGSVITHLKNVPHFFLLCYKVKVVQYTGNRTAHKKYPASFEEIVLLAESVVKYIT
jgi:hypothetical protein